MLIEDTLLGPRDKVKIAIERLQMFEPREGYYLAFSGGKDSQCVYHLLREAGVRFQAYFAKTTVDPPELIWFVRKYYPDVIINKPPLTMWQLIEKKGLPTRNRRWCCEILKERYGEGRMVVTGVRWEESKRRKNNRAMIEYGTGKNRILLNDNGEGRQLIENCQLKGKVVINPIIDWTTSDVWAYIHSRQLPYCQLYKEGFDRIGCIGCPLTSTEQREKEFIRWSKFKQAYLRAIARYLDRKRAKGEEPPFATPEEMFDWWLYGKAKNKQIEGQIDFLTMEG